MRVAAESEGETGVSGSDRAVVLVVHDEGDCDGVGVGAAAMGCRGTVTAGAGDDDDDDGNDESPDSISR